MSGSILSASEILSSKNQPKGFALKISLFPPFYLHTCSGLYEDSSGHRRLSGYLHTANDRSGKKSSPDEKTCPATPSEVLVFDDRDVL
jgi:hypothetical protein